LFTAVTENPTPWRDVTVSIVVIVKRQRPLLDMVGTLHSPRRFTSRLNGRQKKGDQNADDRNNDKKFDERKASKAGGG
jgi:hypothetical protein